jgi:hypothetical protein
MMAKKTVTEELDSLSFYDVLDGSTPEQVIDYMQGLRREYGERVIYFSVEPYGYDGGLDLSLYERRLETDAEYTTRTSTEKKARDKKKIAEAKKEASEYAEYLRLQKKFESVD